MYEQKFSKWIRWKDRNNIYEIKYPGVYILAISDEDISDDDFCWISEIVYVGMTNAVKGLKGRLTQFDNTIRLGKKEHGGAERFRYMYPNYYELSHKLYLSVAKLVFEACVDTPDNLRKKGEIAKFEYECLAHYFEKFKMLPKFNDKKASPKS